MPADTHPSSLSSASAADAPTLRLRLQRRGGPVETFVFQQREITIGRRPKGATRASVDLELPHRDVSRRQCRIFLKGAEVVVEDLQSAGGTARNGRPLRGPEALVAGDVVSFGDYTARVEVLASERRRPRENAQRPALAVVRADDADAGVAKPAEAAGDGARARDGGLLGGSGRAPAKGESAQAPQAAPEADGAADPARAETWWRLGEPAALLLRGRALRRASRWLAAHVEIHPDDRRRRYILASQREATRRRWLRLGVVGASLATVVTALLLGDAAPPPGLAAHERPASACTRDRVEAAAAILDDDARGGDDRSVLRAAAALRWLADGGCRTSAAELALDRALLARSDAIESTLPGPIAGITPIVGDHGRALVHAADGSLHLREPAVHGLVPAMGADEGAGPWVGSADGGWWARVDGRGRVDVWTALREPARVASLAASGSVAALAFDRGGHRLVIADGDGLALWERDGPRWEARARRPLEGPLPAGATLSIVGDGVVLRRGAQLSWQPLVGGPPAQAIAGAATAVLADGDATWFVGDAAGTLRRLRIRGRRWQADTIAEVGAPIVELRRLAGEGELLVVGDRGELRIVRPDQRWRPGEAVSERLEGLSDRPLALASDARWIAAAAPGRIVVWERGAVAQSRRPIADLGADLPGEVSLAVIGDAVISGDARGALRRWSIVGGPGGLSGDVVALGARVDALAIGGGGLWLAASGDDRRTRVWRRELAAPPVEIGAIPHGHDVAALAIDPRGRWLAIAQDRAIELWALGDRLAEAPRARLTVGAAITRMILADDGKWLVVGDARGGVAAWPLTDDGITGAPALSFSHDDAITALVAIPGSPAIVSADRRGALVLSRPDGGARRRLGGHARAVIAAAVDERGEWLATSGEDGQIRLARLGAGAEVRTIAHPGARTLAFAPGGDALVSGDERGELWLHRLGGDERRRLGSHGPRSKVRDVVFDGPDRLVSAGTDGALRIWELRQGVRVGVREARALTGHESAIRSFARDPQARVAVTGGEDGILRIWPLTAEERVLRACAIVGHGPDPADLGGALPAEFVRGVCR